MGVMDIVNVRDPVEKEFHQAVTEVIDSVKPVLGKKPEYRFLAAFKKNPWRKQIFY